MVHKLCYILRIMVRTPAELSVSLAVLSLMSSGRHHIHIVNLTHDCDFLLKSLLCSPEFIQAEFV